MNDDMLKKLLQENSHVPRAHSNEWSQILTHIESNEKKNIFARISWFKSVSFVALALVIFNFSLSQYNKGSARELQEIDHFLLSDSYFNEQDAQYSWVEDF